MLNMNSEQLLYDFVAKDGNRYRLVWKGKRVYQYQKDKNHDRGYRLEVEDSSGAVVATLQIKKIPMGSGGLPNSWEPWQIWTKDSFRRLGLATELYKAAEKTLGFPPRRSKEFSEEGRLFRNYYHRTKPKKSARLDRLVRLLLSGSLR